MSTFRLHIRPGGGLGSSEVSFAYCLAQQVLGVGWPTYLDTACDSWEEYEQEASKHHDDLSRVRYLRNEVKKDDLIWTRDAYGEYYLARVVSEWEYLTSDAALDADIVNVVRCEILKVQGIDSVPGKIVACFRPARTIQRISDENMDLFSRLLWNELSGKEHFSISECLDGNIFPFLGSEETEDLIFIFLQTLGWIVIPNSRKGDTMSFEFYLIHRDSFERAIVQIKTGHSSLNTDDWAGRSERVFLFQSNGLYFGSVNPRVECIPPVVLQRFMTQNRGLLPTATVRWMDRVGLAPTPTLAS